MEVDKSIDIQDFNKLNLQKLVKTKDVEILTISLEKDCEFPEHISPKEAHLIVLEGDIEFFINREQHQLRKQQLLSFPKDVPHWVFANENSKFLIIR